MEKNKFYFLKDLDKKYYNLEPIEKVDDDGHANKFTYHKILNTNFNKKDKNTKKLKNPYLDPVNVNISKKSKNNKTNKKVKNIIKEKSKKNIKTDRTLLSSVTNFDILHRFIKKLKLKHINLLFEKLKMLKMQKKHIFFYLKNSKLFLVLKKHVFKQGFLLLKSLISNKVDRNTNNKVIKNFYNLLIN